MTFRRLFDAMMRRSGPPDDERSQKAAEIEELTAKTRLSVQAAQQADAAANKMQMQARLGSYRRVKLPR